MNKIELNFPSFGTVRIETTDISENCNRKTASIQVDFIPNLANNSIIFCADQKDRLPKNDAKDIIAAIAREVIVTLHERGLYSYGIGTDYHSAGSPNEGHPYITVMACSQDSFLSDCADVVAEIAGVVYAMGIVPNGNSNANANTKAAVSDPLADIPW